MLNLIAGGFRIVLEFILWGIVIVSASAGALVGYSRGNSIGNDSGLYVILGIIGGIIGGIVINIIWGGLIAIFLRIDNNLKILIKIQGGQPIDDSVDIIKNTKPLETTHSVIEETELKDSLSIKPKIYRMLKLGEKVIIKHAVDRPGMGGKFAFIQTENNEEGWCLLDKLKEEIVNNKRFVHPSDGLINGGNIHPP